MGLPTHENDHVEARELPRGVPLGQHFAQEEEESQSPPLQNWSEGSHVIESQTNLTSPSEMVNYTCIYCRQTSPIMSGSSCPVCGAPYPTKAATSDSGWEELPGSVDMAKIQFGRSNVQIEGSKVPVADFNLDDGEKIFFTHDKLIWAEESVALSTYKDHNGWLKRQTAGMPRYMVQASGMGHIALSDNHPGEIVAVPLPQGTGVWVREHVFLAASEAVGYDFEYTGLCLKLRIDKGNEVETEYEYPIGQYDDIFHAQNNHGLLLLHSPGDTVFRDLKAGEIVRVQPKSLIYRDLSVHPSIAVEYPAGKFAMFGRGRGPRHVWLDLRGPGRVMLSSRYEYEFITSQGRVVQGASTITNWNDYR